MDSYVFDKNDNKLNVSDRIMFVFGGHSYEGKINSIGNDILKIDSPIGQILRSPDEVIKKN